MSSEVTTVEEYMGVATKTLHAVVDSYHIKATIEPEPGREEEVKVPVLYGINEKGASPVLYRAAKGSPEELQQVYDEVIAMAAAAGDDLRLYDKESVLKVMYDHGIKIDCSNLAYHFEDSLHHALRLGDYSTHVTLDAGDIYQRYTDAMESGNTSWMPKMGRGEHQEPRFATPAEIVKMKTNRALRIKWIAEVFGKDPEFITGAKHIGSDEASVEVSIEDVLVGDLLFLRRAGDLALSHVGMVERIGQFHNRKALKFWHVWNTTKLDSFVRRDHVEVYDDEDIEWSHPSLADPRRYARGFEIRRPKALDALVTRLSAEPAPQVLK